MKITKEADYALRIVAMLAQSGKQMEAKTIAERNYIPYRFTLKILRKMVPRWCHGKKKALFQGLFNIKRRNRDFIKGFFRFS